MNESQLTWRRGGIGSSDAPIVMGVSPWRTPYQLWQDKVFGAQEFDNSAMRRGRDMEETARQAFEKVVGTLVAPDCLTHPHRDWMRASVDGIDAKKQVLVEIKCPNREDHGLALSGKVPTKYWPQVQHQLEVTGLDGMFYFSFDGREGVVVEVKRDQSYIDSMLEKELKFWDKVLSKEAPDLTEDDYADMEGDSEWMLLAPELVGIIGQENALDARKKEILGRLKLSANGRSAMGFGLKLQRQICKGNVDYGQIPELKGVDLELFRKKPIEKWVPRVM